MIRSRAMKEREVLFERPDLEADRDFEAARDAVGSEISFLWCGVGVRAQVWAAAPRGRVWAVADQIAYLVARDGERWICESVAQGEEAEPRGPGPSS